MVIIRAGDTFSKAGDQDTTANFLPGLSANQSGADREAESPPTEVGKPGSLKELQELQGIIVSRVAATDQNLPFDEHVYAAVQVHQISCTSDGGPGWKSLLFDFVRAIKTHPAMAGLTGEQAFHLTERTLQDELSSNWGDLYATRDDAQAEFFGVWDKVLWLPGHGPLDNALELAKRYPVKLPDDVARRRPDGYSKFISVAFHLQQSLPLHAIALPVEELGSRLGVNPATISRYRRWAVEDGYLQEVRGSTRPIGAKAGRAAEFNFVG